LFREEKRNVQFFDSLLSRTKKVLRKSRLPIIHTDETEQQGNTFGARITSALQDVFSLGYDNVIVVGSDCPNLGLRELKCSTKALANGQQVLGADKRGGAYLIGIKKEQFQAQTFAQLPWQSANLLAALRNYLTEDGKTLHLRKSKAKVLCELKVLADLNTWLDLRILRSILLRQSIFLQLFLAWQNRPQRVSIEVVLHFLERVFIRAAARRGPPILG